MPATVAEPVAPGLRPNTRDPFVTNDEAPLMVSVAVVLSDLLKKLLPRLVTTADPDRFRVPLVPALSETLKS